MTEATLEDARGDEDVEELFLFFFLAFPVDFLLRVWMVSLHSVRGRGYCVCVSVSVCMEGMCV